MGGERKPEPSADEKAMEEQAKKNREEMDKVPPPGTDPLHEGP